MNLTLTSRPSKFSSLVEIFAFSDSIVRDYLPNAEEVVK